jgi:hypothetical protein
MKKLCATLAAGVAVFAGVATAGNASAATTTEAASPQTVLVGGRCEDYGTVRINTSAVYVYAGPGTEYARLAIANRGAYLSCWKIVVGNKYRLCFDGPANGWIPVDIINDGVASINGYVPSTCTTD